MAVRRQLSLTDGAEGTPEQAGERAWISAYLAHCKDWLQNHSRSDQRRTVYRMEAMERLVAAEAWDLELPLIVRRSIWKP